jgi:hypothetical protein
LDEGLSRFKRDEARESCILGVKRSRAKNLVVEVSGQLEANAHPEKHEALGLQLSSGGTVHSALCPDDLSFLFRGAF